MCNKSLSTLCGRLVANYGISMSPQALNKLFNNEAVEFMQKIFADMVLNQNEILKNKKVI